MATGMVRLPPHQVQFLRPCVTAGLGIDLSREKGGVVADQVGGSFFSAKLPFREFFLQKKSWGNIKNQPGSFSQTVFDLLL